MKYSFHHGNDTLIVLISQKEISFRRTESVLSIYDVDWNADLSHGKQMLFLQGILLLKERRMHSSRN